MYCECGKISENRDTGECSSCARERRKLEDSFSHLPKQCKQIKRVSGKMASLLPVYSVKRVRFLKHKKCAVFPDQNATTVHHQMGRIGYADQWARENDIPLLLDERYWLPTSMDGHTKIENNPEWAIENGYSYSRLAKI